MPTHLQTTTGNLKTMVTVGFSAADYLVDGSADGVQIQAAINSLSASGGIIFLKQGTYDITAAITVPSNVRITGEGSSTTLKAAATLANTTNIMVNSDPTNGNTNITIDHISFDGNFTNRTQTISDDNGHNLVFKKVSNSSIYRVISTNGISSNLCLYAGTVDCSIQNCTTYNPYNHNILLVGTTGGIEVKHNLIAYNLCYGAGQSPSTQGVGIELAKYANENLVLGNVSRDNLEGGIHAFYYSTYNTLKGNILIGNQQNGISLVDEADYNIVEGNYIKTSTRCGIAATIAYLETHGGYNTKIINNTIVSCGQNGIRGSFVGSDITGNRIVDCGASGTTTLKYGAYLTGGDIIFQNNRVLGSADRGVEFVGNIRCQITNNYIADSAAQGLFIDYSAYGPIDTVISGNVLENNVGAGLLIYGGGSNCTITHNVCKSTSGSGSGINLRGQTKSVIANNVVSNNLGYGIFLQDDTEHSVYSTGNVITGNIATANTLGGIVENTNCDNNILTSNNCLNNTTANLTVVGSSSVNANNLA